MASSEPILNVPANYEIKRDKNGKITGLEPFKRDPRQGHVAEGFSQATSKMPMMMKGMHGTTDLDVLDANMNFAASHRQGWTPLERLGMRLSKGPGEEWNEGISVAIFTGANQVFVFCAKADKAIIFEDDVHLFPSDSLIGQFRLFAESVR